jgi:hypothetical protein
MDKELKIDRSFKVFKINFTFLNYIWIYKKFWFIDGTLEQQENLFLYKFSLLNDKPCKNDEGKQEYTYKNEVLNDFKQFIDARIEEYKAKIANLIKIVQSKEDNTKLYATIKEIYPNLDIAKAEEILEKMNEEVISQLIDAASR